MPQREGSVGAGGKSRRAVSKVQPTYTAGEDLAHGKNTGLEVESVDKDSDGFERFDDILSKNDKSVKVERKATRRSTRRSGAAPLEDVQEENDDDEESMSLDEQSSSPTPVPRHDKERTGGSNNRTLRQTDVDYNRLPSPSTRTHPRRAPQSSPLRNELRDDGPSDASTSGQGLNGVSIMDDGGDMGGPEGSMVMSFTGVDDQDDDAEKENRSFFGAKTTVGGAEDSENFEDAMAEIEDRSDTSPRAGRSRFLQPSPPVSIPEPEPEQDPEPNDELDEEDEQPPPKPVKSKKADKENKPAKGKEKEKAPPVKKQPKKVTTSKKHLQELESDEEEDDSGLRRSKRMRYEPLKRWKNETVIYGRRDSGRTVVPVIKAIIRLPDEPGKPLSKKGRSTYKRRMKSTASEIDHNPELGWDDNTESMGIVRDMETGETVEKRIAFTAAMVRARPAVNNDFFYQKIFGDGEFIAAGQLIIPPGGKKPPKSTKDNTYVFYVIEGAVNLMVHDASFILATGAMFLVPRGNTYCIENMCERDAKLFFAQARKIPMAEFLADAQDTQSRRTSSTGPSRAPSQPGSAG